MSDAAAESADTNGPHDGERGSFLDGYLNRPLIRFAHLAVLVTFAFGQPLFDLLSKEPEFFASRGSKAIDIFVFALCVTLAYERTGSILVPIGMHALFNFTSLLALYLNATGVLK